MLLILLNYPAALSSESVAHSYPRADSPSRSSSSDRSRCGRNPRSGMCTMITEPFDTCESIVLAIHSGSEIAQSSQYVSPSAWRSPCSRHALGDAYCDDWAVPDPEWIASTMLSQVSNGSVLIVHMPERGFRPHLLRSLELLLDGLSARGYECATLSELSAAG